MDVYLAPWMSTLKFQVLMMSRIDGASLSSAAAAALPSLADAQKKCELDEAQELFGQQPRPTGKVERPWAASVQISQP